MGAGSMDRDSCTAGRYQRLNAGGPGENELGEPEFMRGAQTDLSKC